MADDSQETCVLSLQKFPKELRRRLKVKAAEREIDLKDLCAEYLETALAEEESERPSKSQDRIDAPTARSRPRPK